MFKKNTLFCHKNNTDVAFEVLGYAGVYEDSLSLIVCWWNIVPSHPPFKMSKPAHQVINIKDEQVQNWEAVFELLKGDR